MIISTGTDLWYCGDTITQSPNTAGYYEQCDGGSNCNINCTRKTTRTQQLVTDEEKLICEVRDCSDSYYDSNCWICEQHNTADTTGSLVDTPTIFMATVWNVMKTMDCSIDTELVQGYVFSFELGITTVPNICEANLYGPVLRKYLAKFMSVYAIKVLGMKPNIKRVCEFTDMRNESFEM